MVTFVGSRRLFSIARSSHSARLLSVTPGWARLPLTVIKIPNPHRDKSSTRRCQLSEFRPPL